jgi:hypothetical protein
MLWSGIKKLGKELGFKRTNSEVVGTLKNCFIKMYDGNNMKVLEIFSPELDDTDKEYILNVLNQNKIKRYEWQNCGVRIIFQEYIRPYSIIKIKNILFTVVEHFEKNILIIFLIVINAGFKKRLKFITLVMYRIIYVMIVLKNIKMI